MAKDHCAAIPTEVARPSKVSTGIWRVRLINACNHSFASRHSLPVLCWLWIVTSICSCTGTSWLQWQLTSMQVQEWWRAERHSQSSRLRVGRPCTLRQVHLLLIAAALSPCPKSLLAKTDQCLPKALYLGLRWRTVQCTRHSSLHKAGPTALAKPKIRCRPG